MLCLNDNSEQAVISQSLLETEAQSPCDSHSGGLQIETALQTVCVQWILTGFFPQVVMCNQTAEVLAETIGDEY